MTRPMTISCEYDVMLKSEEKFWTKPLLSFCTSMVEPRMRVQAWQRVIAPLAWVASMDAVPGSGSFVAKRFGDFLMARSAAGAARYVCGQPSTADDRSGFRRYCMVQLLVKGSVYGRLGENFVELNPGDIYFAALDQQVDVKYSEGEHVSLFVPQSVLDVDGGYLHGLIMRNGRLGCGMLTEHMSRLMKGLSEIGVCSKKAASDVTLEMLRKCLRIEEYDRKSSRKNFALQQRIYSYIEDHIDDPEMTPSSLMSIFHMSRSQMYRLFEQRGGVQRYLLDRRLKASYRELSRNPDQRISDVIYRFGFSDERQFQRGFKKRFGMTASELCRSRTTRHGAHKYD